MDDFIDKLQLEVSKLIRIRLKNSKEFHFTLGNDLDDLIKDHVDIRYICFRAESIYFNNRLDKVRENA